MGCVVYFLHCGVIGETETRVFLFYFCERPTRPKVEFVLLLGMKLASVLLRGGRTEEVVVQADKRL